MNIKSFKTLFILLLLVVFPILGNGQTQKRLTDTIKAMFDREAYSDLLLSVEYMNPDTLNSDILYYAGLSAFVTDLDSTALDYFLRSIEKNPFYSNPYYYIGLIYYVNDLSDEVIKYIEGALRISPFNVDYKLLLANTLLESGKTDTALILYYEMIEEPGNKAIIYLKMGDIYLAKKDKKKALDIYYRCFLEADDASEKYNDCVFNIGLLEKENHDLETADYMFSLLLDKRPLDYYALENLIQVVISRQEWTRATILIEFFYTEREKKNIPEDLMDKYVFADLHWKDTHITGEEYFVPDSSSGFKKHVFYIYAKQDDKDPAYIAETIPVKDNSSSDAYIWQIINNGELWVYSDLTFNINSINYKKLLTTLKKMLEGKLKPDSIIPMEDSGK
jgi:tetratricopeptide (TPR) repeat protein